MSAYSYGHNSPQKTAYQLENGLSSPPASVLSLVYAELLHGEEVRVSGNVPALGHRDPDLAIPLVTTPAEYPLWRTKEPLFLPGDAGAVKYIYCIFSGGKFKRWENIGEELRPIEAGRTDRYLKVTEDQLDVVSQSQRADRIKNMNKSPSRTYGVVTSAESRSYKARQFAEWSKKTMADLQVNSKDSVIIVSYFLPVILKKKDGHWAATWDKENVLSLQLDLRLIWVGSIRYANAPIPMEEEDAVARVLADMNCYPVFINQNMHYQFYDIFCKQNLWLVLHHIVDVYGPMSKSESTSKSQQNLWFSYSTVHKLFRDKVLEVFQESYLVWIHGFHLMLLPTFLRRRISTAKIGYYFHTPFPSSEIWRSMARREDLIRGILGADQIGFHLYEYARHFLTTCRRLLGCSYEMKPNGNMTITIDGREVVITCIHIGVDLPRCDEILFNQTFEQEVQQWKNRFSNKIIISGIDRLERIKGIPLKLLAVEQFMTDNPQWIGKVVFILVGITAGERGTDYWLTLNDVQVSIERLNNTFSVANDNSGYNKLIYFEERHDRDIRLAQRLPLFAATDVLMITATRDGLNRMPMEFTLARRRNGELAEVSGDVQVMHGASPPHQGTVILSEFVSSARVMRGALTVNPWRIEEVVQILSQALEMNDFERTDRFRRNLEYSTRLTTSSWAIHVLHDLKAVPKSSDPNSNVAVGFGLQYKVMNLRQGFHQLESKNVLRAYRTARQRLILLDWGGTLVTDSLKSDSLLSYAIATGQVSREGPSSQLKTTMELLCSDVKNMVFVVSGKEVHAVQEYFGSFKGLGLGAEHGSYYRWPRDDLHMNDDNHTLIGQGKWRTAVEIIDQSWKESAKLLMDIFVQRTQGAYIEQKGNALIWQYRDADPEFGYMQSKELEEHLNEMLSSYPVTVIRGGGGGSDGYIEVRPSGVSKGNFLSHVHTLLKTFNKTPDFVLAIGDDLSDEPMFEQLNLLHETHKQMTPFSVTVGKKPSAAASYVDDPIAVMELLTTLSKVADREKKYFSTLDLPSHGQVKLPAHQLHFKAPPTVNESGQRFGRAISTGKLAFDNNPEKVESALGASLDMYGVGLGISRVESNSHLSMTEYMNSINSGNDEDDGGIFF